MTKPTAEEALEWLGVSGADLIVYNDFTLLVAGGRRYEASSPLEAIRNAMKGESDD